MSSISQEFSLFHDRVAPEASCHSVGYLALIMAYNLRVFIPENLSAISSKHRKYSENGWNIYTPRYMPQDTILGHLTFALKYEGVDLAILNALFDKIDAQEMANILKESLGDRYYRRIWFFYEWLTGKILDIADSDVPHSIDALDEEQYYVGNSILSKRHRVRNNLPGVRDFCPLIRKTAKLEAYIAQNLSNAAHEKTDNIHPDVLSRAAAFLLLKDSRASFEIEGERPGKNRAERWGRAICKAGQRPLSAPELESLQNIVIEDSRFVKMGFRKEGGFVGIHERLTNNPMPDHISARWEDIDVLIQGLVETSNNLKESEIDPIIAATIIAFGFLFIHPFEDGNGRVHRYLIHHVLNEKRFSPDGIVFPVSAAILNATRQYKEVLESYSKDRLDLIDWRPTSNGNIEVLNETIDLYRYFDATKQAEFLYDCVNQTIEDILPDEVLYLEKYDRMKSAINERFDMPNHIADLLIRFLEQNNGKLSIRAREKEFKALSNQEILELEEIYDDVFYQ